MGTDVLSSALRYAALGWSIIPIERGTKEPPRRMGWKRYQRERADDVTLRRWFEDRTDRGLAVVCGEVSGGLACRDFDRLASYLIWAKDHPELARRLPTAETVRGRHVYFRSDIAAIRRHSKSGDGTILDLGDGELRGGGYCLLPPSLHPEGATYRWSVPLDGEVPFVALDQTGFLPDESPCDREDIEGASREGCPTPPVTTPPNDLSPLCSPLSSRSSLSHRATGRDRSVASVEVAPENGRSTAAAPDRPANMVPAASGDVAELVELAIQRTLPTGRKQRNDEVWNFARELKAIAALTDAALPTLKPHVRAWHMRALPFIGTKPFETTWFDFARGWSYVRFPAGQGPIAMLFAKAAEGPLPDEAKDYETAELRLLVSLCRELQREAGDKPFFLDCRTAGSLLKVNHATVARWLHGLQYDGILKLVERGDHGKRRANRYRYVAEL